MLGRCDAADRKYNSTHPANPHGPIGTAARAYGRIEILGCGPFAEATPDSHAFIKRVATAAANDGWREMGARSALEARAVLITRTRQRLGVAFARATAEFTLRQLRFELGLSNRSARRSGTQRRAQARRTNAAASDAYDASSSGTRSTEPPD